MIDMYGIGSVYKDKSTASDSEEQEEDMILLAQNQDTISVSPEKIPQEDVSETRSVEPFSDDAKVIQAIPSVPQISDQLTQQNMDKGHAPRNSGLSYDHFLGGANGSTELQSDTISISSSVLSERLNASTFQPVRLNYDRSYDANGLESTEIEYISTPGVFAQNQLLIQDSSPETTTNITTPIIIVPAPPPPPSFQMIEVEPAYAVLAPRTYTGDGLNNVFNGAATSINIIDGDAGDDTLIGGALADEIWGGNGHDNISGGDGGDKLVGLFDNDVISGNDGSDWIWGGDGQDVISGGIGDDFLSGNDDNDIIFALDNGLSLIKSDLNAANILYGGDGDDQLYGSSGTDTMHGGNGADTITSGSKSGDSYEDYVLTINPLIYYRLGESVGSIAVDAAGNQNATYSGGLIIGQDNAFIPALSNKSTKFLQGDDQVISATDDARFDTTQGTVNAWFSVDNLTSNYTVFSKDGNGSVDGQFYIGVNSSGNIYGRVQQDGTSSSFSYDPTTAVGSKVQADQWYMLTMSYDAGGADFYLNGQLIGSNSTLTRTDSDRDFIIGGRNSSSSPQDEFYGFIDEVSWHTSLLDATGVNNLYQAGINAVSDALNITTMNGGDGNDQLTGNDGIDVLDGGAGQDVLYGGGNADVFMFKAVSAFGSTDTIKDFDQSENDKLDLSDILTGLNINAGNVSDFIDVRIANADSYEDYIMALDPLVYFRLNESSGSLAIDRAGNVPGTYSGGSFNHAQAGFNGALADDAVHFNGANDEMILASDSSIFDTTQGTVTAWFNADDTSGSYTVFGKDGSGNTDGQFYVGVNSSGNIFGRFQQDGTDSSFSYDPTAALGSKVQAGQWYMLTLTYGAGGANVYLNGKLLGSDATLTRTDSDRGFMIGASNYSTSPAYEFKGAIDDVAWLRNEMNGSEVTNLYNAGVTATTNVGLANGLYVDTSGTGTFNAGNLISSFEDTSKLLDELTMLNNGNIIV